MTDRTRDPSFTALIRCAAEGDESALHQVLVEEERWVRDLVRRQLGGIVRRMNETNDIVQEVMLRVLRGGPPVTIENRAQFRNLMSRVVLSTLRSLAARYHAEKRSADRRATGIDLGQFDGSDAQSGARIVTPPDERADRSERTAWIALARDLLSDSDQDVLRWREWEGLSHRQIGDRLGISEDGARMRVNRATRRLGNVVLLLRAGRIDEALRGDGALET